MPRGGKGWLLAVAGGGEDVGLRSRPSNFASTPCEQTSIDKLLTPATCSLAPDFMSSSFSARLAAESARADAAENQVADLLAQIHLLHREKLQLRADLSRTQQELQLWKIQLELAQKGA